MSAEVKPGSLCPKRYKQTEVGVIPEEWEVKTLCNVAEIRSGIAKNSNISVRDPILVHYLRVANVQDGFLDLTEMSMIEVTRHDLKRYAVLPGDVLMNEGGDLDKLGRGSVWQGEFIPCVHQNHVFVVRCRSTISHEYLNIWTGTTTARRYFLVAGKQTTNLATINKTALGQLPVVLPRLPEQRTIAEALSDVDALLGTLDRLIAKKRDLKQAAMQQLLTGQTRLPGFHGEWEVKRLGDCLLSRPDYGINAAAVSFSDKLPSYIRITDISEHGRFCPDRRVSVNATRSDQYYLQEGDVVFARTGASVGKSYLYEPCDGELVFAGFLIRVRPNSELLVPAFLAAYATTKPYWNWVRLMSMRSGQPGINGNEYAQLPLSLPPLPEQTAIAAVLSDMDAELAALEQRRDKTRALKQGMMQELLTGRIRLV
jgi:type I restriction enzyme S subunit